MIAATSAYGSCIGGRTEPNNAVAFSIREVRTRSGTSAGTLYAACMIPWIIMAVVAVPLVVIAFVAMRRKTAASELPADDAEQAREEQEFAEAEAYDAKWREEDKERSSQERFP